MSLAMSDIAPGKERKHDVFYLIPYTDILLPPMRFLIRTHVRIREDLSPSLAEISKKKTLTIFIRILLRALNLIQLSAERFG